MKTENNKNKLPVYKPTISIKQALIDSKSLKYAKVNHRESVKLLFFPNLLICLN